MRSDTDHRKTPPSRDARGSFFWIYYRISIDIVIENTVEKCNEYEENSGDDCENNGFFDTLDRVTIKGKRWWILCKSYNIQPHFLAYNAIDFSENKCYDVITVE